MDDKAVEKGLPFLAFIPPVALVALALMFWFGMQRDNPDELPSALVDRPAPAVTLSDFPGLDQFDDALLRDGNLKLVNFWASWCAPCRVEHPNLMQLQAEGLLIYGVNYKDTDANASAFLAELGNPFAAGGGDPKGAMALDWGVYGVPETYLLDGDGTVLLRIAGPVTQREIAGRLRPILDTLE